VLGVSRGAEEDLIVRSSSRDLEDVAVGKLLIDGAVVVLLVERARRIDFRRGRHGDYGRHRRR
jgi:hypothetical protein